MVGKLTDYLSSILPYRPVFNQKVVLHSDFPIGLDVFALPKLYRRPRPDATGEGETAIRARQLWRASARPGYE